MNNQEAQFLLRAYRPDGQDAQDPMFAEPLAQAERDPQLRTWLEREKGFDTAMAAKLKLIQPPAGLRESILAGVRASQPRRRWWTSPVWLAAAAAVALLLSVTVHVRYLRPSLPGAADFAAFAIDEIARAHDQHSPLRPEMAELQARLANAALPMSSHIKLDADELRRLGCRTVKFAGRETFEICFYRGGNLYHLYVTAVEGIASGLAEAKSLVTSSGHFSATAWKDAKFAYALVTYDGVEALRQVI